MIETRAKLWRSLGAAALVSGLVACQPAREAKAPAPAAPASPAAPAAPAGGEQGEAGAADAYAGLAGAEKAGVRLQHMKGFLLAAQKLAAAGQNEEARILVQQGLLEVLEPAVAEVGDLDLIAVRRAGSAGEGAAAGHIGAAIKAIDTAQAPLGEVGPERVRRMLALTRGLYREVVSPEGVDSVEYQHAYGAALAAAQALSAARKALEAKDGPRTDKAIAEMQRLVAMWPAPVAPEKPTPMADVEAQAARVELALSGF